jgi:hypothetical protein
LPATARAGASLTATTLGSSAKVCDRPEITSTHVDGQRSRQVHADATVPVLFIDRRLQGSILQDFLNTCRNEVSTELHFPTIIYDSTASKFSLIPFKKCRQASFLRALMKLLDSDQIRSIKEGICTIDAECKRP